MSTTRRRVARKPRRCDSGLEPIRPGDVYLEHTLFPGNDVYDISVPARSSECAACATRYGRGDLL